MNATVYRCTSIYRLPRCITGYSLTAGTHLHYYNKHVIYCIDSIICFIKSILPAQIASNVRVSSCRISDDPVQNCKYFPC